MSARIIVKSDLLNYHWEVSNKGNMGSNQDGFPSKLTKIYFTFTWRRLDVIF